MTIHDSLLSVNQLSPHMTIHDPSSIYFPRINWCWPGDVTWPAWRDMTLHWRHTHLQTQFIFAVLNTWSTEVVPMRTSENGRLFRAKWGALFPAEFLCPLNTRLMGLLRGMYGGQSEASRGLTVRVWRLRLGEFGWRTEGSFSDDWAGFLYDFCAFLLFKPLTEMVCDTELGLYP